MSPHTLSCKKCQVKIINHSTERKIKSQSSPVSQIRLNVMSPHTLSCKKCRVQTSRHMCLSIYDDLLVIVQQILFFMKEMTTLIKT